MVLGSSDQARVADRKDAGGHGWYSEAKIGDREQQGQHPGSLMRGDSGDYCTDATLEATGLVCIQ
jgi:hypothetical protein